MCLVSFIVSHCLIMANANWPVGCAKSSSDFRWYSSDMDIASVSTSGVLQAKQLGKATVRVSSAFDPFNYDEVTTLISVITCN